MRTTVRPGARNFAEVIVPDYCNNTATICRGTKTALGEKKPQGLEAVSQITDKYQVLKGKYPAFFLEPERYKGTS